MRYDKLIYLRTKGKDRYDDATGDWIVAEPIKIKRYANINHMGDEKMTMLLGGIVRGALTIRLNAPFADKVDYIEYEGKKYDIKQRKKLGNKESFQVVEV